LEFLGLLIMENKLKEQSSHVLKTLNECNVRTVMATGDNVLTAISVARQCKMLDPEKKVFLGELIEESGNKVIQWSTTGGV
jgi:P-type E1-E2 ATPase